MQRSNSIKETRDLQEEFVHKAESQLETFQQTMQSMSDTASQSELNATQTSLSDQRLPLKQIPQKAPAPTTRHLRHILRTASKAARQVGSNLEWHKPLPSAAPLFVFSNLIPLLEALIA